MDELYDSSGVDVTLIRDSLSMTPAERLECLDDMTDFVREVWRLNGIAPYFGDPESSH